MKLREFYKTSFLTSNGRFLLLVLLCTFLVSPFLIKEYVYSEPVDQMSSLNGMSTKYNDKSEVSLFFNSIKKNQGYLCMGTSESGEIDGYNYFDYLNHDEDLGDKRFSISGGAGRTCSMYIPIFEQHKSEVSGMKIIYLINPVYWRSDLVKVSKEYWKRYNSYGNFKDIIHSKKISENRFQPVLEYVDKLNPFEKFLFSAEFQLRKFRRSFFHDLRYNFDDKNYLDNFTFISSAKNGSKNFESQAKALLGNVNADYNVFKTFHNFEWFQPIKKDNDYRYRELIAFIETCKHLNIKAEFILGPYNKAFVEKYAPSEVSNYDEVVLNIKKILESNNSSYIDASDISNERGAFSDHQHHSTYGAYLIYQKIKDHVLEK
ncbi:MAG: hypothetical protein ACI9XP_001164 [Lentimonas sp.]|jgi:hypothetical protein